ncbi:MAG TPA: cytochrome P450 [Pseudaminobacter sp.]|nr:cytochrome P450 [Pseudaminobacter sp.]
MARIKYFEGVREAQSVQKPASELPRFDLRRLRTDGLASRIVGRLLEDPRWALSLLRRFWPILRVGKFVLVTRNDDVRDVLERQDEFETPYGPEMTEIARGSNFILGMQDGPDYRRMKSSVLSAFPPDEVEAAVRPIAARHSREIMTRAAPGFDVVRDLLKIVPVHICREYFGMLIDDENEFADWSIALSALFFSDPGGSAATRETAVVAADRMIKAIDRSIEAVRDGRTGGKTPLGRLVAMLDRGKLTLEDIHSIMLGMIAGFGPTNLLASGNCLDVILSRPDARAAVEQALAAGDDALLDKAILEAMRFKPIWIGPFRYTPRDTVIAKGTRRERVVKAGTVVMPATLSAMFDPDAVQRPNDFDATRPYRDYLVFGHGIHLCIGSAIARIQIGENLRALFAKKNVRRAKGKAGRLTRIAAFPDSLKIDFEPSPLCRSTKHSMVTVVCPIKPTSSLAGIREKIATLGNPAGPEIRGALDASGVIHFASLAVAAIDDSRDKPDRDGAHLVLELSGDGSNDEVLDAFADHAGPLVRDVFEQACNFPGGQTLRDFMHKHAVEISPSFGSNAGLVFSGTPGLSVRRIRAEAELAEAARVIVEKPRSQAGAAAALADVRQRIERSGNVPWAFEPAENALEGPKGNLWRAAITTLKAPAVLATVLAILAACWWITYTFVFGYTPGFVRNLLVAGTSLILTVVGVISLIVIFIGLCFLALRRLEKRDRPSDEMINLASLEAILEREDRTAQNHLTAISVMKFGTLRRLALRLTFYMISISAQKVFRPGFLADINTIHFARWVLVPGTNKLMFFSNYGGSWESYLEDFVAKAASGLTGVWSNTEGYPKTRWLFLDGARDGDRFKRWARRQQIPTLFWYSAYPDLNTSRIRINSKIRQGIAQATDSEANDWLRLFGSMPRPEPTKESGKIVSLFAPVPPPVETLESGEIQSVFFSAFGSLEHARMLTLRIPEGQRRAKRKEWLEFIAARTSFGEGVPVERAMMVAFGPEGLRRLGLEGNPDHDPLSKFPLAFRQGMGSAARSRILDDIGESAPDNWQWGSPAKSVDAVVVCYAATPEALEADIVQLTRRAKTAGMVLVAQLPLAIRRNGKKAVEQFGFVDGVSQPIVRGTPRASSTIAAQHLISAGEFLFGYRDEHGFYPPTPTVRPSHDRSGVLPALRADNVSPEDAGLRDFGRNGSFLVVRQFEQHVDKFKEYCVVAAEEKDDPEITPRWIAAKMVGRWQDGTSLVRNPDGRPGRTPDNDFTFGAEDPQGLRCPLGAHVRRSNPRDSLGEDHETQIRIGKRHRILRIGRTYEKENGDKTEKGLLFMCLNAEIERQYEFMQQTWVSSASFHGLLAEKDPTIGAQVGEGRFSIPRWEGAVVLKGIPSFVTTRGGGYFFLPSRAALLYLITRL